MCDRSCIKERRNQGNVRIIAEGEVVMWRKDGGEVMIKVKWSDVRSG